MQQHVARSDQSDHPRFLHWWRSLLSSPFVKNASPGPRQVFRPSIGTWRQIG
jgi:hypothetical protein